MHENRVAVELPEALQQRLPAASKSIAMEILEEAMQAAGSQQALALQIAHHSQKRQELSARRSEIARSMETSGSAYHWPNRAPTVSSSKADPVRVTVGPIDDTIADARLAKLDQEFGEASDALFRLQPRSEMYASIYSGAMALLMNLDRYVSDLGSQESITGKQPLAPKLSKAEAFPDANRSPSAASARADGEHRAASSRADS